VNIIAPAKMPLFSARSAFDLLLCMRMESNRDPGLTQKQKISGATIKRVMGRQIRLKKMDGNISDRRLFILPRAFFGTCFVSP